MAYNVINQQLTYPLTGAFTGSFTGSLLGTSSYSTTSSFSLTSSYSTIATQMQSGSIKAFVSSNIFLINSGSANLIYVSASSGNVGISGYVTASAIYSPTGNINTISSTTINNSGTITTSNERVTSLLSYDVMTSLKSFVAISGSGGATVIISYEPLTYYGVIIDGIAYDVLNDESLIFRCSLANTNTKVGATDVAILSTTNDLFSINFTEKTSFIGAINESSGLLEVRFTNNTTKSINLRPMYRLIKQCITNL